MILGQKKIITVMRRIGHTKGCVYCGGPEKVNAIFYNFIGHHKCQSD